MDTALVYEAKDFSFDTEAGRALITHHYAYITQLAEFFAVTTYLLCCLNERVIGSNPIISVFIIVLYNKQ